MSRAAVTKSRAEKTKGGGTAAPTIAHEIVPGKFTDHDWFCMLDRDDGTEFASELVDEVVDSTLSIIYDSYIQKQLLPFTLSQAKDAILQIIDWQFLARDELETDISQDSSWQEDEEPLPALADCWAQGIVPRQVLPSSRLSTPQPTDLIIEEVDETEEVAEAAETTTPLEEEADAAETTTPLEEEADADSETELRDAGDEQETDAMTDFSDSTVAEPTEPETVEEKPHVKIEEVVPQPPTTDKPKRKFAPHKGRLKSAGVGAMTETLYETEMRLMLEEQKRYMEENNDYALSSMPVSCQSILKSQAGRPPGNKDVIYDAQGNVIAVVKFNPAKLPSHFVKTGFTVVNPDVEAAHARLHAMKTGSYVAQTQKKKKVGASQLAKKGPPPQEAKEKMDITPRNLVLPLPPPLIELMEVSAGVTIKEGERVKRGPKKWSRTGPQVPEEQLRLVRPPPERPRFTAADILGTEKPILKMIRDNAPIPPIKQISTV